MLTRGKLLTLTGIKSKEIGYNPAVIQTPTGETIIAARIEDVNSYWLNPTLYDPHITFFNRRGDCLEPIVDAPIFYQYEDPFVTWITENNMRQILFGAVKLDFSSSIPTIATYFFLAPNIFELNESKPVAIIKGMKDIRVCQIEDGQLAVFTRPTEGIAFPGRIGFTRINKIEQLEVAALNAPLLRFDISQEIKMGANEACLINDTIHVMCHQATTDSVNNYHYAVYEFNIHPTNPFGGCVRLREVATRNDFPKINGLSKGNIYQDVIFPGGTGGSSHSDLYVGVEDSAIGVISITS
jgi:hypothetical protein